LDGVRAEVACSACGWRGALPAERWRWVLGADEREVGAGEQIIGETVAAPATCAACERPIDERRIAAAVAADTGVVSCAHCDGHLTLRALDAGMVALGEGAHRGAAQTVNIACTNCGGQLVVDGSTAKPACTFCGTHNVLPADVWRRLHPLVHPFYVWMPRRPRAASPDVAPRTSPWAALSAIGTVAILAAIGVSIFVGMRHRGSSGPRGWGVAGQSCNGMEAACSTDKKAELRCGDDDTFVVALTCKGPQGCRLTADGESVSCDYTLADENDPCTVEDMACSTDKKAELRCDKTKFVKVGACTGPDGCAIAPNDKHGYTLSCDDHIANAGDLCLESGRSACTVDKRATLVCKGDGRFAIDSQCLGPTGCTVRANPTANTTTIACDKNNAPVGDRCDAGNTACNLDSTALLVCRNGALVVAKQCTCVVANDVPACK
jgi:hypothetical protein